MRECLQALEASKAEQVLSLQEQLTTDAEAADAAAAAHAAQAAALQERLDAAVAANSGCESEAAEALGSLKAAHQSL